MGRREITLGILLSVAAACGGGGGGGPPPPIEQEVAFALVAADRPATREVALGHPLEGELTVTVVDDEDLDAGAFAFTGAFPRISAAGGTFTTEVAFAPPAPGDHAGALRLRFRNAAGAEQDFVLLLAATVEQPSLALATSVVDLGDVRIGATGGAALAVRNTSLLTPVRVDAPPPLPAGFRYDGAAAARVVPPGAQTAYPFTYEPVEIGAPSFDVTFTHDAGDPLTATVTAATTTWIERQIHDFGAVPVTDGATDWIEVDVPPHGISLSLEARGPETGALIGLLGLEGPGGRVYENDEFTGEYLWNPSSAGVFTQTVPQNDRDAIDLVPGGGVYRFRFTILAGASPSLDVRTIVLNRPDGIRDAGVLDLNVFFVDGLGITALDAPTNPRVQAILAETDRILGIEGLRLGDVSYFRLSDPAFDEVTSGQEFGDLLEESVIAPEDRANVFFVRTAFGGGVLGVAARLGGPVFRGSRVSGVMVDYDFGADATAGLVTAHELGHFLGLFHTTESNGSHDIIDDTLECPANGTDALCPTVGNDNFMHWRAVVTNPTMTPGQGKVVLSHPLVDERPPSGLSGLALLPPPPLRRAAAELPPNWCGCCVHPRK